MQLNLSGRKIETIFKLHNHFSSFFINMFLSIKKGGISHVCAYPALFSYIRAVYCLTRLSTFNLNTKVE